MHNKKSFSRYLNGMFTTCALVLGLLSNTLLEAATEKTEKVIAADGLLAKNSGITEKYQFFFRDKLFVGYPDVYSPLIFPGAQKQKILPVKKGDHFLEMGCGTGVFAICAALDGAERVVAIDINPNAVANTLENSEIHGVQDKLTVLQGDMFSPLQGGQQFDVIFFNIPFCHRNCSVDDLTMLGRSLYDPEHALLHRYLKEGGKYLKPSGRLLLGYSTTHGDIELMRQWAQEYGWDVTLLHKEGDEKKDFITVELYQLTLKSDKK